MTRPRSRALLSVVAVLAAATAFAACGEREEPGTTTTGAASKTTTKVDLILDYLPNADHAGIYSAIGSGEFAKAGLDVQPRTPGDAAAPLKLLLAGKGDLAISYEPELFLARDKGAQLVSVAAIVQRPLTSLMSTGGKPIKLGDLAGKTIGTAGIPYQSAYLRTILEQADVKPSSVKEINVGYNLIPAMLTRKVDMTLGAFWNVEGVQLERQNKKPSIVPVDEAGVPTYDELILVARKDYAEKQGPTIRRFIQALMRGTNAVKADPAAAITPLLDANPDLKRSDTLAEVKASLDATPPVFFPENASKPFGWQEGREWERFATWMLDEKLLTNQPTASAFTNEYLPGQGVGD